MRAPVVSRASKLSAAVLALLLACMVGPAAMADELSSDSAAGGVGADVAATADAPMLASLMAGGAGRVNAAVALEDDPEPVVGSFTVGGLTYAIVGEGKVALVAVGPGVAALAAGPAGAGEGLLAGSDGTPLRRGLRLRCAAAQRCGASPFRGSFSFILSGGGAFRWRRGRGCL